MVYITIQEIKENNTFNKVPGFSKLYQTYIKRASLTWPHKSCKVAEYLKKSSLLPSDTIIFGNTRMITIIMTDRKGRLAHHSNTYLHSLGHVPSWPNSYPKCCNASQVSKIWKTRTFKASNHTHIQKSKSRPG